MNDIEKFDKIKNDWKEKYLFVKAYKTCAHIDVPVIWIKNTDWENPYNESLFDLLHEIGHKETYFEGLLDWEAEYFATIWAIVNAHKYEVKVTNKIKTIYQEYIWKFTKDRNIGIFDWRD